MDYEIRALTLQRSDGATLEGWHAVPASRTDGVIIYFGGRNENVQWVADMASFCCGKSIYAFNYRGFGHSTGLPSESWAKLDAQVIHSFVASRERMDNLTLIGRSLGSAIALWLARDSRPQKLVLLSPFERLRNVVAMRGATAPLAPFLTQQLDCRGLADHQVCEVLVLLAEDDTVVAHAESLSLWRRLSGARKPVVIAGTSHKTLPRSLGAQLAIADFV